MIKLTKKQVNEMAEAVWESLARNGMPVVYEYGGKVDVSRGDTFGTAAPVYTGKAKILMDTQELKDIFDRQLYTKKEAADILYEILAASITE